MKYYIFIEFRKRSLNDNFISSLNNCMIQGELVTIEIV